MLGTIKTFEWLQNIRKQIDYKKPLNTKQMNRIQNIQIEVWKYKAVGCLEIKTGKVSISLKSLLKPSSFLLLLVCTKLFLHCNQSLN